MVSDLLLILQWWFVFFIIGIIFLPLTQKLFSNFFDFGYSFSKIIGILILSYTAYILSFLKIVPFSTASVFLLLWIFFSLNVFLVFRNKTFPELLKRKRAFLLQEIFFLIALISWSYVRGFQPDINGLEKFMDFGFVNSILRSSYMPPTDMWFSPEPINYYYFGHFITAVLTKISLLPSFITYNLMMATLFAFCFIEASFIGFYLVQSNKKLRKILTFFLAGAFTALGGNLHTIYAFFKPYENEHPKPLWDLVFSPLTLSSNSYWYPNATRFIQNTIHEFPIYSFIVSDLHGHVLNIPVVLLIVALLLHDFLRGIFQKRTLIAIGAALGMSYMTNAWDLMIYGMLTGIVILSLESKRLVFQDKKKRFAVRGFFSFTKHSALKVGILGTTTFITMYLFNSEFVPFASQIGILCSPEFLTKIGAWGPFLFEKNHCQHSLWWQLLTLYGFFYFFVISFFIFLIAKKKYIPTRSDIFVTILIFVSTILIALPEFVYAKDIYPAHYRANTMFKLTYQAFMMLCICSAYILVHVAKETKNVLFSGISILLTTIVLIYPFLAIPSYYGNFTSYKRIDGIKYLSATRPQDYSAINWINSNIEGQPFIVEAQGDSYTDYERVSSNTGLPTILGWTVHEWLWRGSYEITSPRIEDVKTIYESKNIEITKSLLKKYNISYVYIGDLEYEKYPNLDAMKFESIGDVVFEEKTTKLIKLHSF